jgi:hypothetical protein
MRKRKISLERIKYNHPQNVIEQIKILLRGSKADSILFIFMFKKQV